MKQNEKQKNKIQSNSGSNFIITCLCLSILCFGLLAMGIVNYQSGSNQTITGESRIDDRSRQDDERSDDSVIRNRINTSNETILISTITGDRSGEGEITGYNSGGGSNDGEGVHAIQERTISITTYNPTVAQNDSSPCISSLGINICDQAEMGVNVIALSQDLIKGNSGAYCRDNCFVWYGDTVRIEAGECSGDYVVLDAMNKRWTNKADIFLMDSSKNTRCSGTVEVIKKYINK